MNSQPPGRLSNRQNVRTVNLPTDCRKRHHGPYKPPGTVSGQPRGPPVGPVRTHI